MEEKKGQTLKQQPVLGRAVGTGEQAHWNRGNM